MVHESVYLTIAPDGVITEGTTLLFIPYDKNPVQEVTVIPDDKVSRFNEWDSGGIGIDAQHNIFKREFLTDNDLRFETFGGNRLFALQWIMAAKVLVKTPAPFYVYRNSPDSVTRAKLSPEERVTKFISQQIELSRYLDKFFSTDDFFKDKPEM